MSSKIFNGTKAFTEFLKVVNAAISASPRAKVFVAEDARGPLRFEQCNASTIKEILNDLKNSRGALLRYKLITIETGLGQIGDLVTATLHPDQSIMICMTCEHTFSSMFAEVIRKVLPKPPATSYTKQELEDALYYFEGSNGLFAKSSLEDRVGKAAMTMGYPMAGPPPNRIISIAYNHLCTKGGLQFAEPDLAAA